MVTKEQAGQAPEVKAEAIYQVCPITGRRMAKLVCVTKIEKGICVQNEDGCYTKGKRRDHSQEKLIKVIDEGNNKNPKEEKMKTKKEKKVAAKKPATKKSTAEKDEWGFKKDSKSSQAIKMLASGKALLKDTKKKFNTLSFGILLAQLEKNGFTVKEDAKGLCTVK